MVHTAHEADDEPKTLRDALLMGCFQAEAAAMFGVSRQRANQVATALRAQGFRIAYKNAVNPAAARDRKRIADERRNKKKERWETIRQLKAMGWSNRQIVERTGIPRGVVSHYVHTHGLATNPPYRPRRKADEQG